MPPSYPATISKAVVTTSAKILQDQLHELITRLTLAGDHIKTWVVESGSSNNDGSAVVSSAANAHNTTIHAESTARFIVLVHEVMKCLQKVESSLKTNAELRQILQHIHVPYDLLELLDYTNINPDLYLRGLVNEATQQLIGLQRRKNALHLLSTTIENRLNCDDEQKKKRQQQVMPQSATTAMKDTDTSTKHAPSANEVFESGTVKNGSSTNNKRDLESSVTSVNLTVEEHQDQQNDSYNSRILDDQPAAKKQKI